MRKPVSKHALRRALESARAEGIATWDGPAGSVVDHIWHQIEKEAFGTRKKPGPRPSSVHDAEAVEA
jgi:hypothetical protein